MGRSIPTTKELLEKFILIEEKHNLEHENLKETLDLVVNKLVGLDKHNDITEVKASVKSLFNEVGYLKNEIKKVKVILDNLTDQTLTNRESLRNITDNNTRRLDEIESNKNFRKDKSANVVVGVAIFLTTALITYFITKGK